MIFDKLKTVPYDKSRYSWKHAHDFIDNHNTLCGMGVFLAGGIWTSINYVSDYDIFVYGDCDPRTVASIIAGTSFAYISIWDGGITVKKDNKKYQIITKKFPSPMVILNEFDITACKIGYDFQTRDMIVHPDFTMAWDTGCIDINKCNVKQGFGKRIDKYLRKKLFTICNLDLHHIGHGYYLMNYDSPIIYKIANGYIVSTYYNNDTDCQKVQFYKYCKTIEELLEADIHN